MCTRQSAGVQSSPIGQFPFLCSLRMIMGLPVPKPAPGAVWLVKMCSVITHINSQGDHLLKYVGYVHGIMNSCVN